MIESLQQLFNICDDISLDSNQVTKKTLFIERWQLSPWEFHRSCS